MTRQDTDHVSITCRYCRFREATGAMQTALLGIEPACDRCQSQYRMLAYRILSLAEYLESLAR